MGRSVYFDWSHVRNASLADFAPPPGSVPQVSQTVVRAVPPFVHDRRQMVQAVDSEVDMEARLRGRSPLQLSAPYVHEKRLSDERKVCSMEALKVHNPTTSTLASPRYKS